MYYTIKDQPRYSSVYKIEAKEAHSVKHNSTKLEKQTPRQQNKYHSRFENSTERNSKNGLNTSKTPCDKQCERNSSRKRERDNKRKSKRGNKPRNNSFQRQSSSENIEPSKKERGLSVHTRPHSVKEHDKDLQSKYASSHIYNTNCDYKRPEEFHKLRYSFASSNESKPKRPSSAKRKEENPLNEECYELKQKLENSRNGNNRQMHRSRSNREASRESEKSDRHQERPLSKTKSTSKIDNQNKQPSFHHTANLKFNSILKDIGAHSGNVRSAHIINYQEKPKEKDYDTINI